MLYRLTIWLLLGPMLLNGLWIVCSDRAGGTVAAVVGSPAADAEENCAEMCLMKHGVKPGSICFLLPGDAKASTSITVLDFGFAILPQEFQLEPIAGDEPFMTGLPSAYTNPSLATYTPPPKA
jgi:hypothetical protein